MRYRIDPVLLNEPIKAHQKLLTGILGASVTTEIFEAYLSLRGLMFSGSNLGEIRKTLRFLQKDQVNSQQ